jgi:WG containing repeat
MKILLLLTGLCLLGGCQKKTANGFLFRIEVNNKIGFIDNVGNVVIPPKFLSAGNYSEGLIAARINGLYGYVDRSGEFVIKPQFEYATDFQEGYAIVFQNKIPAYIDKNGQTPFATNYAKIMPFENGRAVVRTESDKFGLIDNNGRLLADTLYENISEIGSGLIKLSSGDNFLNRKNTVIDSLGNTVIPQGVYTEIYDFVDGYAKVSAYPEAGFDSLENSKTGFIDSKGNLLFLRNTSKIDGWLNDEMHDGLIKIDHYKYWMPGEVRGGIDTENLYPGFLNMKGEVLLNDTMVEEVTEFSSKRAFIKRRDEDFYMVDTLMNKVSDKKYKDVLNNGFHDGYALVSVGEPSKYGVIDTTGEFIVQPQFENPFSLCFVDDYLFFGIDSPTEKDPYKVLYGIAQLTGKILVEPKFDQIDYRGFNHGLLWAIIDGKQCYVDQEGDIVWQEKKNTSTSDLDIDYMKWGDFYAYSEFDKANVDVFGRSTNVQKMINDSLSFPANQLSVVVKTDHIEVIDDKWNGYKVYVANTTKDTILFDAQDNRLFMKAQALDSTGKWCDIEYLPGSFCGNSYHTLFLKETNYWEFKMPKYSGDTPTKIRIELGYYTQPNTKRRYYHPFDNNLVVYSNVFEARINNSQFWRKEGYSPLNFMDPYFD